MSRRLRGPGEEVDADTAEQLPLGLGHEGVARADQHVDGGDAVGPEGHGAHGLDAAEDMDLMGAAQMHGGNHRRGGLAAMRRRHGHDPGHAGHRGGDHGHVGRGDQRVAPAGDVATSRSHRNVAVAEDHPRHHLHLDVRERRALRLGEAPHPRLGVADIVEGGGRHAPDQVGDLVFGEAKGGRVVAVEAAGEFAHRLVAAGLDIGEHRRHRVPHLRVHPDTAGGGTAFQILDGHVVLLGLPGDSTPGGDERRPARLRPGRCPHPAADGGVRGHAPAPPSPTRLPLASGNR